MEEALHQELLDKIKHLKAFVSDYSTVSLLGTVSAELKKTIIT